MAEMSNVLAHAMQAALHFRSAALCSIVASLLLAFRVFPTSDAERRLLQETKALHIRLQQLPLSEWAPLALEIPPTEACRCGVPLL